MKNVPGWVKGGCLGAFLVVGSILLFVMCSNAVTGLSALKNFTQAQTRAQVARVMSDSRTLKDALDTYRKDRDQYPPSGSSYSVLTTPIAYLSRLPEDYFATRDDGSKPMLLFYTTADNFLIWSVGPDGKSDLDPALDLKSGSEAIRAKTYDATNGTVSSGDIVRTNLDLHRQ